MFHALIGQFAFQPLMRLKQFQQVVFRLCTVFLRFRQLALQLLLHLTYFRKLLFRLRAPFPHFR